MFEINNAPKKVGIYIFKKGNNILYVGKSINIFKRMNQYKNGAKNSWKTSNMLEESDNVEFILTKNENDALILERNLIDENNPPFNIKLKDNRRYPYLYIKLLSNNILIKTIYKVRKNIRKNEYIYGPFSPGTKVRSLVNYLQNKFTFEDGLPAKNKTTEWYSIQFNQIKSIFHSSRGGLIKTLLKQMDSYSDQLKFELAQELRDVTDSLVNQNDKSGVSLNTPDDIDIIGFAEESGYIFATILHYRAGILLSSESDVFLINLNMDISIEEYIDAYYSNNIKPKKIYSNIHNESKGISKIGRGNTKLALETAIENSKNNSEIKIERLKLEQSRSIDVLRKLEILLDIDEISTIAMIDNSHEQNTNITSGVIFYKNGLPVKTKYRKYNITASKRKADVEYMKKGILKYFENNNTPDLLILDGGKAHLNEINSLHLGVEVVALVKDDNHKTSHLLNQVGKRMDIKKDVDLYMFLSKLQVDVDRFAKFSYQKKKINKSLEGELSLIKGIGPSTESKLLEVFGSYSAIYNAPEDELLKVVTKTQAKNIIKKLV